MVNQYILNNDVEKMAHLESLLSIPSINPREYSKSESYNRLDFIIHPEFGQGFVSEVLERNTIKVFFQDGQERVLGHRALVLN